MTILKGKLFFKRNISLLSSKELKTFKEEEEERRRRRRGGIGRVGWGGGKSLSGHSTEAEKSKVLSPGKLYVYRDTL